MIGANGYICVNQIGSMPRVTRCYIWQLGFRVITLGSLGFTPRGPKRAVEDKPGRNSDKTFHCTTSAAYANGLIGLKASWLVVIV